MLQKGIPWWLSVLINLERACWHQPFYVSPHKKSPVSLKARSRRGCSFCNGFYSNSLCFNNHKGKDRRECQVPSAILGHFCGFRKAWALPIIIFIGFMRDRIFEKIVYVWKGVHLGETVISFGLWEIIIFHLLNPLLLA